MRFNGNRKFVTISFIFVFVSFIMSTLISLYSLNLMEKDNQKDLNTLLAARIHDTINSELTKPVMVARTMANCEFLVNYLENTESPDKEAQDVQAMQNYLMGVKNGMDYDSTFVISDATRRYYTHKGLNKIIDTENDSHDVWYASFAEKKRNYDLDVDSDEANSNIWTIFVNARMERNGKFLGVCGVGVKMNTIQDIISEYEKEYNVKINLVNSDGFIQVDTNEINIDNAYLDVLNISEEESSEYFYEEDRNGEYIVTKYVENLGWYLVVKSEKKNTDAAFSRVILLNAGLFSLVAVVILIVMILLQRHTKMLASTSFSDELTGLFNRRAYENEISRIDSAGIKDNLLYVNADVNGLKTANDTLGHAAGDELIKAAADCLKNTFGAYGNVFRIGGDEFAAILYVPEKNVEKLKQTLQKNIENWHGSLIKEVSLSVGYVSGKEFLSGSINDLIKESDLRMYASKEEYYQKTGRDRRKR